MTVKLVRFDWAIKKMADLVLSDKGYLASAILIMEFVCSVNAAQPSSPVEKVMIGLSTHNVAQVQRANELQPDYIGMGPIYPTPTKEKPDPVIGTHGLKEMMAANRLPYVAIGGD